MIEQLALSTQKGQEINYKPQIIENLGLSALALAGKQDFTKSLKVYREYLHEKHKLVNLALDQQLAQFEVQQLTNQVQELEQNKKFQLLEQKQQRQAWKNTVFASVAGALLIFFYIDVMRLIVSNKILKSKLSNAQWNWKSPTKG